MDWAHIYLGILQGITEFLPISSSGHLFLMGKLLKGNELSLSFVLLLHLATFFSVSAVFFKDIKNLILGFLNKQTFLLFCKILLSLAPLLFIGLFFRPFVQQSFEKNTVALGFFSSALFLFSLLFVKRKNISLENISFRQAFLIGLAQALAVVPGFSRSALTIVMGLYCGLAPRAAVSFSFLISLPAIAGSSLLDLFLFLSQNKGDTNWPSLFHQAGVLAPTFFITFLTGILSLLLVLKMVQKEKFYLFSFYLIPLSLLVFLL